MADYDYMLKLLLVGNSNVGKSSLLMRFADDEFTDEFRSTIGVDFKVRTIQFQNKVVKLQIWDTAGQERFQTITSSYYRGCHGILLVYDSTDFDSFFGLEEWIQECDRHAGENVYKVVVASKIDLEEQRQVPGITGQEFAEERNLVHLETSAKTNSGVDAAFLKLVEMFLNDQEANQPKEKVEEEYQSLIPAQPLLAYESEERLLEEPSRLKEKKRKSKKTTNSENPTIRLRALVISAKKRYERDQALFGFEGDLLNGEVSTLDCERYGPYEEEIEFTWNHTFPGDETDLGSEPFDFVVYFLKYPGDARKLQQFIEPYQYVRHRYAKCGSRVFAPKFVARNNLHVHRTMAGNIGDKAVDDLLGRERGFSELVSRVWKKLDPEGKGSLSADDLSSIMSSEDFNVHFSDALTEKGLHKWWASGAKGPLLNHIRELTQSDKSILRFFSREIKAFVDPSYYDYNELNRRNISFQFGGDFEARSSLEVDLKWGLTDEAKQAHATELCLDRYAREHVATLYFKLKPGVEVESLQSKINNFLMHLTSARGCIDRHRSGQIAGILLAGPNIYCKVVDNRLALSFSQDVSMAMAQVSRSEYNTFHSWFKDFLQIPAVQQTLSGKVETSFSPQTILDQPDTPLIELFFQNVKAFVKARLWKGWRTFLFEYEKAMRADIAPIMAWFMLGKADIDIKAASFSDFNPEMFDKIQRKFRMEPKSYNQVMKFIMKRYNRFIHKHTYMKGISDFIFQNLETDEIEIKVFLQNLQANAMLKTQGLEQLLNLKQFEGVDFSKYFNQLRAR